MGHGQAVSVERVVHLLSIRAAIFFTETVNSNFIEVFVCLFDDRVILRPIRSEYKNLICSYNVWTLQCTSSLKMFSITRSLSFSETFGSSNQCVIIPNYLDQIPLFTMFEVHSWANASFFRKFCDLVRVQSHSAWITAICEWFQGPTFFSNSNESLFTDKGTAEIIFLAEKRYEKNERFWQSSVLRKLPIFFVF